jgi:pimeloyl-ACP methyl ester carboxylesterase
MVAVEDGRRLNLYCTGDGSPTVVLEAGHGDGLNTWAKVQPALSKKVRVCSYDRAGFGFSDPPRRPGTVQQAADDLRKLLLSADIKPPYLMVGHSMGGMVVRLYAAEHPRDVVGLVLVDPTNEHQSEGYNRVDQRPYEVWDRANKHTFVDAEKCVRAARSGSLVEGTDLFESCAAADDPEFSPRINRMLIRQSLTYGAQRAMVWEQENTFYLSAAQLAAKPGHYGNKPVLVLFRGPDPRRKGQTQGQADAEYKMLVGLHAAIAARSTRGEARLVNGTGHYIQMDAPDAVVNGILDVLKELSEDAKAH